MKKLLMGLMLVLASTTVSAQNSGFYAGGSIGQSQAKDACDDLGGTGISCDDKDTAWKVFGGYQFNRHFAAEIGYTDLGKVSATLGSLRDEIESTAFELVGVGMFPIANNFSVYGKLGLYRGDTEERTNFGFSADETNTDLTFGFGVRYDFAERFAVRGEWQRYQDVGGGDIGESHVDVISVGFLVRF